MTPYYSRDGIVIYCGDCLEVMPNLGNFDLVLTDPPYGVLSEEWDDMTMFELARFTMKWTSAVSEKSNALITFFGEKTRKIITPILEMLYPEVRQLIWNKQGGDIADNKMFYAFESIYYCHQGTSWEVCEPKTLEVAKIITEARTRAGLSRGAIDMVIRGKKTGLCYRWEEAACLPTPEQASQLSNILHLNGNFNQLLSEAYLSRDEVKEKARQEAIKNAAKTIDVFTDNVIGKRLHPTQKPVTLLQKLILSAPGESTIILDPFMGSGTTLLAAQNTNRRAVGIELNEDYCRIATERLRQPSFFSLPTFQPKVQPEQLSMEAL